MAIIDMENVTKRYTKSKGIFDVSISVEKGEAFGITGSEDSGKSTVIKIITGLLKPENGNCIIDGYDSFSDTEYFMNNTGYLPENIQLPKEMTAGEFLNYVSALKKSKDSKRLKKLIDYFEINSKSYIKSMSKREIKILAVICCFMCDNNIYVLDEPFSHLNGIEHRKLLELIHYEKKAEKTFFLASEKYEDIEKVCDITAFLSNGQIVGTNSVSKLKKIKTHQYLIDFESKEDMALFSNEIYDFKLVGNTSLRVKGIKDVNEFIKCLSNYNISSLETVFLPPEELFNDYNI